MISYRGKKGREMSMTHWFPEFIYIYTWECKVKHLVTIYTKLVTDITHENEFYIVKGRVSLFTV